MPFIHRQAHSMRLTLFQSLAAVALMLSMGSSYAQIGPTSVMSSGVSAAPNTSASNPVSATGGASLAGGVSVTGGQVSTGKPIDMPVVGEGSRLPAGSGSSAKDGGGEMGFAGRSTAADGKASDSAASDSGSVEAKTDSAARSLEAEGRAIKDQISDETEFQRFVRQATGRGLPLFGYELFRRGPFAAAQGASVPASYVLGPGDELVVQAYGLVDFTESLIIDRDGRVLLPKAGPLSLAGVRLSDAERVITAHLAKIYRNFNLTVTMGRLRSTEIFVVGQANKPGKHVVSGLSTVINALFETGGPSANGSLRAVELRRAGRVVSRVDLYRFLALGETQGDIKVEPGDVIVIPPAGPRAAVLGTVNTPAIYELRPGETIQAVLDLSGGLPVLAAPQKAQLERVDPARDVARYVEDFSLDGAGLSRPLKAGDILTVFQISPQIADVVTLQGNVAAPMRYTWRKGMRVADLVAGNSFLVPVKYWLDVNAGAGIAGLERPEVNLEYATIQRLDADRLRTRIIPFHLAKALRGLPQENLSLEPGDIVRVYGPRERAAEALDSVTLQAAFLDSSVRRFVWRSGSTVRDVIPDGVWLRDEVERWVRRTGGQSLKGAFSVDQINLDYAVIRRFDATGLRSEWVAFNLGKALRGDAAEDLILEPGDQIVLYTAGEAGQETLNSVTIGGDVLGGERRFVWRPGFTIRDIIPSADWLVRRYNYWLRESGKELRNDINWDYAQVTRRVNATLQTRVLNFNLGGAVLQGRAEDNIALQPGDRIRLFTTFEMPVPVEKRTRLVTLAGEVRVPGVYQVSPGETLNQLIERAGGLTAQAYAFGVEFTRNSVRQSQQRNLESVVRRLETQVRADAQSRLQNINTADQAQSAQAALRADEVRLSNLRTLQATGRVALGLDPERVQLPALALDDGDVVTVPTRPAFVGVYGAVNNENAIIWRAGLTVDDAIARAGPTTAADRGEVFILRADGTVVAATTKFAFLGLGGLGGTALYPGDTVVVPEKSDRETPYTTFIRGAKDLTAIFYQFGLGAAALKTLQN